MIQCLYCSKECKNVNSQRNHQRLCSLNPNRAEHPRGATGKSPWNKGKPLPYEVGTKGKPGTFSGKKHSDESKKKMSLKIIERYENGWEPKAGRCKKYDYESTIAGKIKVDGTWELIFCKYLDAKGLTWARNKKRFPYIRPDGVVATYQPDFYVEDWKTYVEVKGYETALDRAKWVQFPEPLKVLRRKEIGELDEWLKSAPC